MQRERAHMMDRLEAGQVERACDSMAGAADAVGCSCGRGGLQRRNFAIRLSGLGLRDAVRALKKDRFWSSIYARIAVLSLKLPSVRS